MRTMTVQSLVVTKGPGPKHEVFFLLSYGPLIMYMYQGRAPSSPLP